MADARREKLTSVYFDTDDLQLRDKGVSLRVRHKGRTRLQTIKTDGRGSAAFSRKEWEQEIAGDMPDLGFAKGTALAPLAGRKLARKLRPVFETRVTRIRLPLSVADGMIELAIDRGHIRAGKRSARISELELELKDGDPRAIIVLARRLAKELPVRYGVRTKAERGYALAEREAIEAACAEVILLDATKSAADAFTTVGLSCLRHLARNEEAVRQGDAEGVHQMRVGLRRLRAALSLFKEFLQDRQTEVISTDLKWLTEQLGPARDLDVFVKDSITPLQEAQPRNRELAVLTKMLKQQRAHGFAKAKNAVEGDRYRTIVLYTALWLSGGEWRTISDDILCAKRELPIMFFAQKMLAHRTRKILKKIKKLEDLDARHRHKLRIAIKKLRYATEFFASLFMGKTAKANRKAFGEALERLQSVLGKLNDIRVHIQLANKFVHDKPAHKQTKARETAFAMGLVMGQEQTDIGSLIGAATKAGARLGKASPFWD